MNRRDIIKRAPLVSLVSSMALVAGCSDNTNNSNQNENSIRQESESGIEQNLDTELVDIATHENSTKKAIEEGYIDSTNETLELRVNLINENASVPNQVDSITVRGAEIAQVAVYPDQLESLASESDIKWITTPNPAIEE